MPNAKNIIGKGFDKHPEHILGKGRPRKIPSLDILMADIFTEKEMTALLKALQKAALKGNVRAMELLFDRLYGKVKQQTELSGSISTPQQITGIQIVISDDSKN